MTAIAAIAPFEKACKKCGEVKPLDKFQKCSAARDGREGTCGPCKWVARACKLTAEQKEAASHRARLWKDVNKDRWREQRKEQRERARLRRGGPTREQMKAAAEARERHEETRKQEALNRLAAAASKPWNARGLTSGEKWRIRYRADPEFNLKERVRCELRKSVRVEAVMKVARAAIRSGGTSKRFEDAVGYSIAALKRHLERQFVKGMDWEHFASGEIHIDHIIPLSAFDLTDAGEFVAAWALSNIQPLWAKDNLTKGASRNLLI